MIDYGYQAVEAAKIKAMANASAQAINNMYKRTIRKEENKRNLVNR